LPSKPRKLPFRTDRRRGRRGAVKLSVKLRGVKLRRSALPAHLCPHVQHAPFYGHRPSHCCDHPKRGQCIGEP
jgi:hypothetical protein